MPETPPADLTPVAGLPEKWRKEGESFKINGWDVEGLALLYENCAAELTAALEAAAAPHRETAQELLWAAVSLGDDEALDRIAAALASASESARQTHRDGTAHD